MNTLETIAHFRTMADAIEAAYDAGHDDGFDEAMEQLSFDVTGHDYSDVLDAAFDDGYMEGVADARRAPAVADAVVASIIQQRAYDDAFNEEPRIHEHPEGCEYSPSWVSDSGDETDGNRDPYDFGRSVVEHARNQ